MVGQRGCTGCRKNGGVGVNSGSSSGGGWWWDCVEGFENARTSEWHMGIGV